MTIHNIGDSKFNREHVPVNLNDNVEITRVNGPATNVSYGNIPNLAVGSHRQQSTKSDINTGCGTEFGGKYFQN